MLIRPLLDLLRSTSQTETASGQATERETFERIQAEVQRRGESSALERVIGRERQYAPVPVSNRRQHPPC